MPHKEWLFLEYNCIIPVFKVQAAQLITKANQVC